MYGIENLIADGTRIGLSKRLIVLGHEHNMRPMLEKAITSCYLDQALHATEIEANGILTCTKMVGQ